MQEATILQVFLNGRPLVRFGEFSVEEGWVEVPALSSFPPVRSERADTTLDTPPTNGQPVVYKKLFGQVVVKAFPLAR